MNSLSKCSAGGAYWMPPQTFRPLGMGTTGGRYGSSAFDAAFQTGCEAYSLPLPAGEVSTKAPVIGSTICSMPDETVLVLQRGFGLTPLIGSPFSTRKSPANSAVVGTVAVAVEAMSS